ELIPPREKPRLEPERDGERRAGRLAPPAERTGGNFAAPGWHPELRGRVLHPPSRGPLAGALARPKPRRREAALLEPRGLRAAPAHDPRAAPGKHGPQHGGRGRDRRDLRLAGAPGGPRRVVLP